MSGIELDRSQLKRTKAIQVAALADNGRQGWVAFRIMKRASKRRSRKLFEADLLEAEDALGISRA